MCRPLTTTGAGEVTRDRSCAFLDLRLLRRALERTAGLREEDVVERRRAQLEVGDVHAVRVHRAHDVGEPEAVAQAHRHVARRRERLPELREEGGDLLAVLVPVWDRVHARASDLGLQCRRRPLRNELPLLDDSHAVGEDVGLLEVLRRQEDGDALLPAQAHDLLPHGGAALRVEPGRRLVEEEDPGQVDEGEREVEAPLHPARVARDLAIARICETDARQQLVRVQLSAVLGDALERRLEAEMVAAGQERVERGLLEGDPDQRTDLRALLHDVVAADACRARGRRQQRRQDVDGRRLARAVRAEEAVDLARRDGEVDPVDRSRALLVLANEPFHLDPVRRFHRPTLPAACAYPGSTGAPAGASSRRRGGRPPGRRRRRSRSGDTCRRRPPTSRATARSRACPRS